MRISKRKINLYKYAGPHKIWIKPYRTRMITDLYKEIKTGVITYIPKYIIIERRGKCFMHYFSNRINSKL